MTEAELSKLNEEYQQLINKLMALTYQDEAAMSSGKRLQQRFPNPMANYPNFTAQVKQYSLDTGIPRLINKKSALRNAGKLQYYYNLAENALKETPLNKRGKAFLQVIIRCLALANAHHLTNIVSQIDSTIISLAHYIKVTKNEKLKDEFPTLYSYLKSTKEFNEVFGREVRHRIREGVEEKRTKHNRKIYDSLNDEHIQAIIERENLKIVEVEIVPQQISDADHKSGALSQKPRINYAENCIVIDKETQNVLAILMRKKLSAVNAYSHEGMLKAISDVDHERFQSRRERECKSAFIPKVMPASQESASAEPAAAAAGSAKPIVKTTQPEGSVQFGVFNTASANVYSGWARRKAKPSAIKVMENIQEVARQAGLLFEQLLPKTYSNAMDSMSVLRTSIPFWSERAPFASATLNHKRYMKTHRDCNRHNFSCLTVFQKTDKQPTTGTCFPEWIIKEGGTEKMATFIVQAEDLFIADFDYAHLIPSSGLELAERYSLVLYSQDALAVPSILECGDSDLDEEDLESVALDDAGDDESMEVEEYDNIMEEVEDDLPSRSAAAAAPSVVDDDDAPDPKRKRIAYDGHPCFETPYRFSDAWFAFYKPREDDSDDESYQSGPLKRKGMGH